MHHDDKLLMKLAAPANPQEAARLLEHPILQALRYSEARADHEFWRRLAGSLRKALTLIE